MVKPFLFQNNVNSGLPEQSQKSRSILQDGSRFLGLFLEEKILTAELYMTGFLIFILRIGGTSWNEKTLLVAQ